MALTPAESAIGTVSTVSLLRHDLGRMSADHRRGRHRGDRTALGHLEPGRSRARGRQGSRVHVTNGRQPAAGTTSFMSPRSQGKSHTACGQPQKTSPQTPAKTLPGNMDARVPPMASSSSRDRDRANCAAARQPFIRSSRADQAQVSDMNDIRWISEASDWVHYGFTPRSLSALLWSGVGRVVTWKGPAPARWSVTVLRVMVRFLTFPTSRRGLAEQDGGWRGSVEEGFDVHGYRA